MTLEHRAFMYGELQQLLDTAVPWLREGVERDEKVVVVVRETGMNAVRDVLGPDGKDVEFYPSEVFYKHPVRTLRDYQGIVQDARPHTVRALAEPVWHGQSPRETREWARYESLINVAFEHSGARALCPYDQSVLPQEIIEHARRTHPKFARGEDTLHNDSYVHPKDFGNGCDSMIQLVRPRHAEYRTIESDDLHDIRAFVGERAVGHGLDTTVARTLVTAVNEVATNAVRHGIPPMGLWIWSDDRDLICEIGDNGFWHADPLTGFLPPESALQRGFGLWTVRLLVDLVELKAGWDGTFVRLHVRR
ncbi:anti-sigma factor RsbA family regulatory protein [Actinomadura rudentiformis]|uniref:Sensor histidine kinase n=1 Tax=Actinomadura rudentiformis TaxID=359158 RepID=A0A6H9YZL3_9ACTN|nr:anti-sigma factor RsbA family regulatory protein [Actinomadura rudentiformis]KAB2346013.1 sensor histidine kinase [Actinomadura rudentiformis]